MFKKLFAEGQSTGIRPKRYPIELADPSWKIRLKMFRIVDALCKYVLFTGDEVRRDPSGHLGLIHSIRSAQVRSKGAASKDLTIPCLTRILVCEPMVYRDCSIFEAPNLSSPRLSLEGNAFQQNFEHAWNQFGVRGQVDIF